MMELKFSIIIHFARNSGRENYFKKQPVLRIFFYNPLKLRKKIIKASKVFFNLQNQYLLVCFLYGSDGGLQIIDITNPEIPVFVGSCDTPGSARGVFKQISITILYFL